ncbi:MAG TPA: L-seryl-tRNA(Sec) selenium transferase, partial [Vicinamibacteria bacterium]|nr:L-seryl-tRNA(Sec) selenium transferase [Vicinamibacteria bacterium]
QRPEVQALAAGYGRAAVLRALRDTLAALRERIAAGASLPADAASELAGLLQERLEQATRPSLRRVINATGVVVHTNLGRAPLAAAAAARVAEVASGYSNLEYDLASGERGQREVHAESRLSALLDVEAALVVNNCAAAVLLAVNTLAEGREVLVSRGELVEIGGSFRIPDVLRKAGARLREVGTTNRTRLSDYRAALSADTALVLKVHPSNFRIVGFTEETDVAELSALAREAGVPLMEDQGSGLLFRLEGELAAEATVRGSLAAGVEVVTFSGDKILGGPQAGLLVGPRRLLSPMRTNPLYRALRVDKMTLAALDATLLEHESGRAGERVPVLRMIQADRAELRRRAEALAAALAERAPGLRPAVIETTSAVGGGAAPVAELKTAAVSLDPGPAGADRLAAALRAGSPPVVVRVADDRVVVDLRTVPAEDEAVLLAALARAAPSP